ncbi:hypothetical protein SAMN05192548_1004243 [Paraburkholderia terricola]|uniref:Uncharacterized protein n=1 Tax=Paraburkholderia terricola TaxID=169427 RepID=A0A1M6L3F3_9BURK|nr:hypothetical protein SAMN05192547_1004243 [Paraburkholderia sediminicola]SHJ65771.1 hypothetical protein SAMN05192548_1004243 [Paraburkholderia terricola]
MYTYVYTQTHWIPPDIPMHCSLFRLYAEHVSFTLHVCFAGTAARDASLSPGVFDESRDVAPTGSSAVDENFVFDQEWFRILYVIYPWNCE